MPQLLQRPSFHRSTSLGDALRAARSREEQETLLAENECDHYAEQYGLFYGTPDQSLNLNPHSDLPVYTTIHR